MPKLSCKTPGSPQQIICLPTQLMASQWLRARTGEKEWEICYHAGPGVLYYREPCQPLEQSLRVLDLHIEGSDSLGDWTALFYCDHPCGNFASLNFCFHFDAPGQEQRRKLSLNSDFKMRSPMTGKVLQVAVENGQTVEAGQVLVVIEAMKMENKIKAPISGTITKLTLEPGASIKNSDLLLVIQP